MRWLVIVIALAACKKTKTEQVADPPPGPPKVGHSITKVKGSADQAMTDDGSAAPAPAPIDAPGKTLGGDGSPAHRDDQGHVHGPGGPVFMGRGPDCDATRDHCLRKGVWFSVGNIEAGKLFRALPVFELEGKWYTWRGEEEQPIKLYRTELAGAKPIGAGTPIIWFSSETSSTKWVISEYEALTSSRWEAGVTDAPSANGSVRVKGWGEAALDSVRVIVETK